LVVVVQKKQEVMFRTWAGFEKTRRTRHGEVSGMFFFGLKIRGDFVKARFRERKGVFYTLSFRRLLKYDEPFLMWRRRRAMNSE